MLSYSLLLWTSLIQVPSTVIDDFVKSEMSAKNIPGLVVLVAKDGKVIKHEAFGVSDIEKKTPMTVSSLLDMGSIGKTFTAALVMQLVEADKLRLEDKISKFISNAPTDWSEVTIRHLLSHQSGIPEYAFEAGLGLADDSKLEHWKKVMLAKKLDFAPGLMFQYSNSNYTLLGIILEQITGDKFTNLLNANICNPAGIPPITFREPGRGVKEATKGYFYEDGKHVDAGRGGSTEMPSDGGGYTTVLNLYKLTSALSSGNIVSAQSLRVMQTPSRTKSGRKTQYGLGWFVRRLDDNLQVSHGGNSVGFSASMSTFPKQNLTVILMGNLYPFGGDEMALQLARRIEPALAPKKVKTADKDPDAKRTERMKSALQSLANSKLDDPIFDSEMRARLSTPRGRMAVAAFSNLKDIVSIDFVDIRSEEPDTVARYRVRNKSESFIVEFMITKSNTIYSISRAVDPGLPD